MELEALSLEDVFGHLKDSCMRNALRDLTEMLTVALLVIMCGRCLEESSMRATTCWRSKSGASVPEGLRGLCCPGSVAPALDGSFEQYRDVDKGYGRIETRRIVVHDISGRKPTSPSVPGWRRVL